MGDVKSTACKHINPCVCAKVCFSCVSRVPQTPSGLTHSHRRGLNFGTFCDSSLDQTRYSRLAMKFEYFKGCRLCVDSVEGLSCQCGGVPGYYRRPERRTDG